MSSPADQQLAALEAGVERVGESIGECVQALVDPGDLPRFVVAERLFSLGSVLIPHLVALLQGPAVDSDLLGCAADLGFAVGDREECAMALPVIVGLLRKKESSEFDEIVVLLHALRTAGGSLPDDLRRLLSTSERWQVAAAVDELFPQES
jgi:hypothetical protein